MARLGKRHKGRIGEVKARSQVFSGRNKRFTKVDAKTGKFMDQMAKKWKAFKGVKKK
ncbi:hypothetical protein HY968_00630 [Candidatus Kaiserbacteria bacterium]|nr:hypothetical protein [Candidatus Kaiserbacteria bacterium]